MSMVVQYRGGGSVLAAASEDQERGRLPSSLGIGGTGESFKGEHGLRVARGFISVLNAAKDDDRERVCSGVSVATRPAGEREKLRRRTKPGRPSARGASRGPLGRRRRGVAGVVEREAAALALLGVTARRGFGRRSARWGPCSTPWLIGPDRFLVRGVTEISGPLRAIFYSDSVTLENRRLFLFPGGGRGSRGRRPLVAAPSISLRRPRASRARGNSNCTLLWSFYALFSSRRVTVTTRLSPKRHA